MRIVVDTNVIISASFSKNSVPFRVLELVIDFHKPMISPMTFEELQETLYKPKFDKFFFPEDTRSGILKTILQNSSVIIPDITVSVCRDPKDNKYLELLFLAKQIASSPVTRICLNSIHLKIYQSLLPLNF